MDLSDNSEALAWSIAPVTIGDYDEIVRVWTATGLSVRRKGRDTREAFAHQLAAFPDSYLKAVVKDRVVGVVFGTHDQRKGWINRVAVLPAYRRKGVAAALVRSCDRAIRAQGIGIVAALVEEDNTASAALFAKLGYQADVPVKYFRKLDNPDI